MNSDLLKKRKKSVVREYIEALLVAGLIALFIRAFIIEAFKIPSGSMIPTLSVGDHIFVNKFVYGLRFPFTRNYFVKFGTPEKGDVIVFICPTDDGKDFIKRVIGKPGDKVRVFGTSVEVNGELLEHEEVTLSNDPKDKRVLEVLGSDIKEIPYVPNYTDFNFYEEEAGNLEHLVQYEKDIYRNDYEVLVPEGHYFVMGDNRDNSADSREWGFVPEGNIKGKAMFVWLSLDKDQGGVRWHEFGRWIR